MRVTHSASEEMPGEHRPVASRLHTRSPHYLLQESGEDNMVRVKSVLTGLEILATVGAASWTLLPAFSRLSLIVPNTVPVPGQPG